jgi:hypothetical protein
VSIGWLKADAQLNISLKTAQIRSTYRIIGGSTADSLPF